ncbi:MAG: bifunctional UDP-N-acetylglucosamine diphosphorylase/glucosamine-1-phosphate N-acetyltransferase GlmU, partial [Deltaproteobacteria bacterium]|nr:bifunctional UDP-N-acetylglucosamine diphosphorylase/glucosamine-1-phosphate N-acetyltransferase GlmU [Deltaproteobacteria bacterium]
MRRQAPVAAIILAAGQGTRMRSHLPKMLHPLGGVPLVHHPLALACSLAADPVVLVVSPEADELCRAVQARFGPGVRFAVQQEPRGTADAVRCALTALDGFGGTALLLCGDVPNLSPQTVLRLLEHGEQERADVAFLSFFPADPGGYGRVVRNEQGRVQAIVEARDAAPQVLRIREVNSGIYAIRMELLRELLGSVRQENAQREFYLTDVVEVAVARGLSVLASEAGEHEVAGVNDRVDLARAERFWRQHRNEELMRSGVTMEDPDTVFVAAGVRLAPDVTLEPSVRLTGCSELASGVRV